MKYLSIDLETSGLDPRGQIFQLSAVVGDTESSLSIEELPYFDEYLWPSFGTIKDIDPMVAVMHRDLFERMIAMKANDDPCLHETSAKLRVSFAKFCDLHFGVEGKITVAGKNAAGFDIPWLKEHRFDVSRFGHRVLDPGPMYWPLRVSSRGGVPNLSDIMSFIGVPFEPHDALEDARAVVYAIDHIHDFIE